MKKIVVAGFVALLLLSSVTLVSSAEDIKVLADESRVQTLD